MSKLAAERNQRTLLELVNLPGNDVCADCKSRNPRWASYSLGIFLCVSCASIHRKMGTHISKVKSLTLDSWTKEQVEFMKSTGNLKSNAHYNPDEIKHPPPTNMIDSERDSDLEKYIRAKYEYKSFVSRSSQVAALLGPSRSSSSRLSPAPAPPRSQTVPVPASSTSSAPSTTTPAPSLPSSTPAPAPSTTPAAVSNIARTQSQFRSVSQPVAPSLPSSSYAPPQTQLGQSTQQPQTSSNPVWNDLAQLQAPAMNSSLPLQYASPTGTQAMSIPSAPTGLTAPNPYGGLSVSPNAPFPSSFGQQASPGGLFSGQPRSMSLNTGINMNMNMSAGAGVSGLGYGAGAGTGLGMGLQGSSPSPSMLHPQPTQFNGGFASSLQNSTPSPGPFTPQAQAQTGMGTGMGTMGMQNSFAPSSFGQSGQQQQQFLQPQPQPQGSPMFASQPLQYGQGSPMFQPQPLGGQMPGSPYMQQQQQPFGSPQPPFMGAPTGQFGQQGGMPQQQQQTMYGQGSAFGGTGWQQPPRQW